MTLIRNGRILRHHLERELITVAELEAAARRQGIESLAHVQSSAGSRRAARSPSSSGSRRDDETRHHETLGLLAQIEARQRAMVEQIAALERKIAGTTGTTP